MMFGLDLLGGAKYEDLCVNELPEGWAFGVFFDTFGNSEKLIQRVAATGRCPRIRVQLIWDDAHVFTVDDVAEATKKATKIEAIAKKFPSVEFRISPFCEHKLKLPFLEAAAQKIKAAAPSCIYVNCPMSGGDIMPNEVNELHGADKISRPGIKRLDFSFDGTACVDSDVEKYKGAYAKAETFYFHEPRFNGRWEESDKTPRPQRKGWPDSNLIDSVIYLARDRGDCKLSKDFLYKSHAENKGNGDKRAEKPLFICPKKSRRIELVANNGQVVGTFAFYGLYNDGRWRYYSQEWGYQIAEKARRIQGHSLVRVRIDGKFYGTINPAFRFGGFR